MNIYIMLWDKKFCFSLMQSALVPSNMWARMWGIGGKRHDIGLGSVRIVSLDEARENAPHVLLLYSAIFKPP